MKKAGRLDELVLLPLYPHFSYATTLSSLKEWRRVYGETDDTLPERTIEYFYDHPLYIEALVKNIGKILRQFPDSSRAHLIFSAHGLPMSLVEKGDPYPKHVEETVRLVCEQGAREYPNWPRTHLLCFQSKVGPAKWLEPSFLATLERLGHEGIKEALVAPISFVTEHIETLHEINIDGRADAKKWGIERFRMTPAVGSCPLKAQAPLAAIAETPLEGGYLAVQAPDMKKGHKLLAAFEAAPHLAAIASYGEDEQSLSAAIRQRAQAAGDEIAPDAAALVAVRCDFPGRYP